MVLECNRESEFPPTRRDISVGAISESRHVCSRESEFPPTLRTAGIGKVAECNPQQDEHVK